MDNFFGGMIETEVGLNEERRKIKSLIDRKAEAENPDALEYCNEVSLIIKKFNSFIDGNLDLSSAIIKRNLAYLVAQFTITLDMPLPKDSKIARAVKFEESKWNTKPYYQDVSRLSYIPKDSKVIPKIGRLNVHNKAMYYACLIQSDNHINVVLSEVKVLENEIVNILESTIKETFFVRYIGVYDYFRRGVNPSFNVHCLYKEIYNYLKDRFDEYLFTAYGLCDSFFSDILRRKSSPRLYEVTSILASLFLNDEHVDGLLYLSAHVTQKEKYTKIQT